MVSTGALVPSSMQYWVGGFVRRASKLRVGQQDGGAPPLLLGYFLLEIQSSCDKLNCFRAPDKADFGGLKSTYLWC